MENPRPIKPQREEKLGTLAVWSLCETCTGLGLGELNSEKQWQIMGCSVQLELRNL